MTTIIYSDGSVVDLRTLREGDLFYDAFVEADIGCYCCKRALNDLKFFGKSGDPIEGDFEGAVLVKRSRPFDPPDEEASKIYGQFFAQCKTESDHKRARKRLVQKYGQEKAEDIEIKHLMSETFFNSWECRECIVLDDDDYFAVLHGRSLEELTERDKRKSKNSRPIEPVDVSHLTENLSQSSQ